ncbi:MAG: hypothetical protein EA384_04760 [Spirochaetaceae bacterium]|nr:MAG: hypothetical protein EA384_04760 [Spirochaetaceae bacterium]
MNDIVRFVVVEAVKRIESESAVIYGAYAEATDHYSARNMLLSLRDASRERLEKVERLGRRQQCETLLAFPGGTVSAPSGSDSDVDHAFDAETQYTDFLMLICRREGALAELYQALSSGASDAETAELFHALARDCERRKTLARSRYDLETLA